MLKHVNETGALIEKYNELAKNIQISRYCKATLQSIKDKNNLNYDSNYENLILNSIKIEYIEGDMHNE